MANFLVGFGVTLIALVVGWAMGRAGVQTNEGPSSPRGLDGPMPVGLKPGPYNEDD